MRERETHSAGSSPMYSEFYDPRLVAIYDTVCPIDTYRQFYLELAAKLASASIIDFGCGTGQLTVQLAERGYHVMGLDPSRAMLSVARRRPGGEQVTWVEGDERHLGERQGDLSIMTGHVAQFFLDDERWHATLKAIHQALRPGGHLAFESRNPRVQPWAASGIEHHADWPEATARQLVTDPVAGPIAWWVLNHEISDNRVRYEIYYLFMRSGEELRSVNELRFRSEGELRHSLARAGFSIKEVYGDWDGGLVDAASPELIFVATRG